MIQLLDTRARDIFPSPNPLDIIIRPPPFRDEIPSKQNEGIAKKFIDSVCTKRSQSTSKVDSQIGRHDRESTESPLKKSLLYEPT